MIDLERWMALTGTIARRTLPYIARARISYLFARLRAAFIGPFGVAVLSETANGRLLISSSDFALGRAFAFRGTYDPYEVELLASKIRPESDILFVGAHVGALLIPLSRRAKGVVGIEANPKTFELLRLNLMLNGIQNAEVFNFAAGDETREVEFMTNVHDSGISKIKTQRAVGKPVFTYDSPATIKVPMRRLDDALAGRKFDMIVMDLEGSEPVALAGMQRLTAGATTLMVEITGYHYDSAKNAHQSLMPFATGFDTACIVEEQSGEPRTWSKSEFAELIAEVIGRGFANVLFWKEGSGSRT